MFSYLQNYALGIQTITITIRDTLSLPISYFINLSMSPTPQHPYTEKCHPLGLGYQVLCWNQTESCGSPFATYGWKM